MIFYSFIISTKLLTFLIILIFIIYKNLKIIFPTLENINITPI